MTWRTHMAVGANAVWLTSAFGILDERAIYLGVAAGVASLVPDIDGYGRGAKIHYSAGGVLGMTRGIFRHRGFFHSILAALIVLVLVEIFLGDFHPLLALTISLGYFSHAIIDGFNRMGVQYLFPKKKFYNLIPKKLRTSVGGPVDTLLFFLGVFGFGLFILTQYYVYITNF